MSIITRIKTWLGICEHDFRLVRRGPASFLRCSKCRLQTPTHDKGGKA